MCNLYDPSDHLLIAIIVGRDTRRVKVEFKLGLIIASWQMWPTICHSLRMGAKFEFK
jgi:hypothetical protein